MDIILYRLFKVNHKHTLNCRVGYYKKNTNICQSWFYSAELAVDRSLTRRLVAIRAASLFALVAAGPGEWRKIP